MKAPRWNNVLAVTRKELLDLIRDRRTLISMIVVPVLLMPVLMIGVSAVMATGMQELRERQLIVGLVHSERSPRLMEALEGTYGLEFIDMTGVHADSARAKVQRGDYQAFVYFPESSFEDAEATPEIKLLFREDREISAEAVRRIQNALDDLSDELVTERLAVYGAPESVIDPISIVEENLASEEQVAMTAIAGIFPYMLIIVTLMGAMYPAIDMTAGEKERGTLETLLASPARRSELVFGKYLATFTTAMISSILSLLSMILMFIYGFAWLLARMGEEWSLSLDPMAVLSALAMLIPLAGLFAALLLTICIFAKSTREAQSYVQPLLIVLIIPAMGSFTPGAEMSAGDAWIPVLNVTLAMKGLLTQNVEMIFVLQTLLATTLYALVGITITSKVFERENVLFRV